jgi:hypothetical protein
MAALIACPLSGAKRKTSTRAKYRILTRNAPRQTNASVADRLHNAYRRRSLAQGTPVTDREKILIALREKPLKIFEIIKRVNIKHQDCHRSFEDA